MNNYPAGVTDNDPHFDLPSAGEDDPDYHPCGCLVGTDQGCDDERCGVEAEKQQTYYAALYALIFLDPQVTTALVKYIKQIDGDVEEKQ